MNSQMKNRAVCMGLILGLWGLTACGSSDAETVQPETEPVMETMSTVESTESEETTQDASETPVTEEETAEGLTTVYRCTKMSIYNARYDEEEEYQEEYEYDENGYMIKQTHINKDGTSWVEYEMKYDKNGNELLWANYDEDGGVFYKEERECDEDGYLTRLIFYVGDDIDYEERYETNEDGKGKTIHYDAAGNVEYTSEGEYDSNGKMLKEVRHNADGTSCVMAEYVYDAEGNRIKEVSYNEDGSLSGEDEYDSDGRLTKSTYDWGDGMMYIDSYQYDDYGNLEYYLEQYVGGDYEDTIERKYENTYGDNEKLVKVVEYRDEVLSSVIENEYDENGVQQKGKEIRYTYDGTSIEETVESEYDENGNEIKYVEYDENGSLKYSEESEYTAMQIPKKFADMEED